MTTTIKDESTSHSGNYTTMERTIDQELHMRQATIDDLDGITKLAIEAFPDDPERDYRFPYRHEYPEDQWKWTKVEYEGFLKQPESYDILVIEAGQKLVALGIWDVSGLTGVKPSMSASILTS